MIAPVATVLLASLALLALGAHRAHRLPVWPTEALLAATSAAAFFAICGPVGVAPGLVAAVLLVGSMRRLEAKAVRRDERRLCRAASF